MMLVTSAETTTQAVANESLDWSELGRLVRVRALTAVSLHFVERGDPTHQVPPRGTPTGGGVIPS